MEIPFMALSSDTLEAIIEEFITREGTDYGEREYSLATKVEQVKQQLQRGEVIINYDAETQTCQLAPRR
jgi:uncharacterized protein YheU (UPF0270 family)